MASSTTSSFKVLFGIDEQEIKEHCVLMPFTVPSVLNAWQIPHMSRGLLYKVAQAEHFTLIHTRMGAGLVGDTVLYLKQTNCKALFLFGSCGLLEAEKDQGLGVGSCVIPQRCYALESFSEFLLNKRLLSELSERECLYPHSQLSEDFLEFSAAVPFNPVTCATVSSLKLEEERLPALLEAGLQVVDMECSAFLAAARATEIPALPLFWISDRVKYQPFYQPLPPAKKLAVENALLKIARLISAYCAHRTGLNNY